MKYLFGLSVFFVLLIACEDKKEDKTDSVEVETVVNRYPNGVKKMEGKLVNGKRQGKWIAYYENGIKWSEGVFVDGLREGNSIVYYESGKKKMEGKYHENQKVGLWKVWEEDGSLVQTINMDSTLSPKDSVAIKLK